MRVVTVSNMDMERLSEALAVFLNKKISVKMTNLIINEFNAIFILTFISKLIKKMYLSEQPV